MYEFSEGDCDPRYAKFFRLLQISFEREFEEKVYKKEFSIEKMMESKVNFKSNTVITER